MEIDKLISPIKKEKNTKEREIENKDKKRKEAILNLEALYESYYYEKQRSIKNAYKLSIQTRQFSFEVFIVIVVISLILVALLSSMFTIHIDVPFFLPMIISLELILLGTLVYFLTGLFLKANLHQSNIQKDVSEHILEDMIIHELISKDELKSYGIEFKKIKDIVSPKNRKLEFTYNHKNKV